MSKYNFAFKTRDYFVKNDRKITTTSLITATDNEGETEVESCVNVVQ